MSRWVLAFVVLGLVLAGCATMNGGGEGGMALAGMTGTVTASRTARRSGTPEPAEIYADMARAQRTVDAAASQQADAAATRDAFGGRLTATMAAENLRQMHQAETAAAMGTQAMMETRVAGERTQTAAAWWVGQTATREVWEVTVTADARHAGQTAAVALTRAANTQAALDVQQTADAGWVALVGTRQAVQAEVERVTGLAWGVLPLALVLAVVTFLILVGVWMGRREAGMPPVLKRDGRGMFGLVVHRDGKGRVVGYYDPGRNMGAVAQVGEDGRLETNAAVSPAQERTTERAQLVELVNGGLPGRAAPATGSFERATMAAGGGKGSGEPTGGEIEVVDAESVRVILDEVEGKLMGGVS